MSTEKTKIYKIGGSTLEGRAAVSEIIKSLKRLFKPGKTVLVHGGGPAISRWLDKVDIKPEFIDGQRVTGATSAKVVEMVLSGLVNKEIVSVLEDQGIKASGVSGRDGGLAVAEVLKKEYGRVGEVKKIDPFLINELLKSGITPVVSPVSQDKKGCILNVNADYFAVALASALGAAQLNFITSVGGVLKGNSVIEKLNVVSAKELIQKGTATEGMIPKLEASIEAVKSGVGKVQIMNHKGKTGTTITYE
ncbi:MAG: acetylglutamate kinase [Elusimicrobia bacterium]|jgi:acetylglutamate kinase|nr:acetylglutamate kinase [Elusimicrobiota bacterium]